MFLSEFSVQSVIENPNTLPRDLLAAKWILGEIKKGGLFVEDDNIQEYNEYCWEDEKGEFSLKQIRETLIRNSIQLEFCGDWYWFFPVEDALTYKVPDFLRY